jgi:hypothetical protein
VHVDLEEERQLVPPAAVRVHPTVAPTDEP